MFTSLFVYQNFQLNFLPFSNVYSARSASHFTEADLEIYPQEEAFIFYMNQELPSSGGFYYTKVP